MKLAPTLKVLISLSILPLMAWMIVHYRDDFVILLDQLDMRPLILLMAIQIPLIGLGGFPFKILMRRFGYDIHWRHWVGLSFIANLLNQLLPYRPGLAFRFMILKKHYQISLKAYTFSTLFYFIVLLGSSSMMMIMPWLLFDLPDSLNKHLMLAIIILFSLMLLFGLYQAYLKWKQKTASGVELNPQALSTQISNVLRQPGLIITCLLGFALIQSLTVASFFVIFEAMGNPIAISHVIFLVGLATLGLLFPITPGNLGLLEALMGGLTEALYGHFSLGFSAVMIYRAAQFLIALIMGTFFSYFLFGRLFPAKKSPD